MTRRAPQQATLPLEERKPARQPLSPIELRRRLAEPLGDPALADKPANYRRGWNRVKFRQELRRGEA